MTDEEWVRFLTLSATVIGEGETVSLHSKSWCSWTTFQRITSDAMYWASGLPKIKEIGEHGVADGGTWGQPFHYHQLAHVIIPSSFVRWGKMELEGVYEEVEQPISELSNRLKEEGIRHTLSPWALEIRRIGEES